MPTYAEIMNMVPKSRHDIDSMIDLHRKGKEDLESVAERGRRFEQQMGLADNQYARGRADKLADDKTEYGRRRGLQQQEGEIDLQIQKEMWGFRGKEAAVAHDRAISMADHAGRIKRDVAKFIDDLNLKSTKNLASFNNHIAKLAANQKHNHRILELEKLFEQNKSLRADQLIEKAGLVADFLPQETLNKLNVKGTDWTSEENKWDLIVATTQAANIAAERNEAKVMYDAGVAVGEFKDANGNAVPFDSFWRYDKQNPDAERYPNASMYGTMRKRITDGTILQNQNIKANAALAAKLAETKFNWTVGKRALHDMGLLRSQETENRRDFMKSVDSRMSVVIAQRMLNDAAVDDGYKTKIHGWMKNFRNPGSTKNTTAGLFSALESAGGMSTDAGEAMEKIFLGYRAELETAPEGGGTSWLQQQPGFREYASRQQGIEDSRTLLMQNPSTAVGPNPAGGAINYPGPGANPPTVPPTTLPLPGTGNTPQVAPQQPPVWHPPVPPTPNPPAVPANPGGAAIMPPALQQMAYSGGGAPMPDANAQLQAMNLAAASQAPVIMNPPIGQLPVAPQQPMYPQGVMNLPAPLPQAQDPYLPLADPDSVMQLAYSNPSIDNSQLQYDPYGTLTPQLPL